MSRAALLFATSRPSIGDVLTLDPLNIAVYRSLHYAKYIFTMYVGGRVIKRLYPFAAGLIEGERPEVSSTENETDATFLTSLRNMPKYFASEAVRTVVGLGSALYIEKYALNYDKQILTCDLVGATLRGLHWLSLRAAGFKDPQALMRSAARNAAEATSAAAKCLGVSPSSFIATRSILFSELTEWWVFKVGLFALHQPVSSRGPTQIKESVDQLAAFTQALGITCHDVMLSFASATVCDLVLSFIVYDLVPRVFKKQPRVFTFEIFGVKCLSQVVSLCVTNALLMKLVGPHSTNVAFCRGEWGASVPVWVVAATSHLIGFAVSNSGLRGYRWLRGRVSGKSRRRRLNSTNADHQTSGLVTGKTKDCNHILSICAVNGEQAADLFEHIVGRPWTSLTEAEIHSIRRFAILVLVDNTPHDDPIQMGMGYLLKCISILMAERPPVEQRHLILKQMQMRFAAVSKCAGTEGLEHDGAHTVAAATTSRAKKYFSSRDGGEVASRNYSTTSAEAVMESSLSSSSSTECPLPLLSPPPPYEAPCGLGPNGEPTHLLRAAESFSASANIIFNQCTALFVNDAMPRSHALWDDYRFTNVSLLTSSLVGDRDTVEFFLFSLRDVYVDELVHDRAQLYGQSCEPYVLFFPRPRVDEETGQPIQTFLTLFGWTAVSHVLRVFKPKTLFP